MSACVVRTFSSSVQTAISHTHIGTFNLSLSLIAFNRSVQRGDHIIQDLEEVSFPV
jgi:hypothetical protein